MGVRSLDSGFQLESVRLELAVTAEHAKGRRKLKVQIPKLNVSPLSMNGPLVGQASRLPLGRLAPESVAGETPAMAAGTAAPLPLAASSWSQCMRKNE